MKLAIFVQAVDLDLRRLDQFWLLYGDDRTKAKVTSLLKVADNIGLVTVGMGVADSTENTVWVTFQSCVSLQFSQLGCIKTAMFMCKYWHRGSAWDLRVQSVGHSLTVDASTCSL